MTFRVRAVGADFSIRCSRSTTINAEQNKAMNDSADTNDGADAEGGDSEKNSATDANDNSNVEESDAGS